MHGEELVGGDHAGGGGDAEERFFVLIQIADVHGVDLVVGQEVHRVVADAEDEERQQGHHQAARGAGGGKHAGQERGQECVFGTESDAHDGDGEPHD